MGIRVFVKNAAKSMVAEACLKERIRSRGPDSGTTGLELAGVGECVNSGLCS